MSSIRTSVPIKSRVNACVHLIKKDEWRIVTFVYISYEPVMESVFLIDV